MIGALPGPAHAAHRGRMNLRAPSIHFILAGALLFLAVAVRIADPEPVARLRLSVFDSYLVLAPRPLPADLPVRIVDIDEASLRQVGQWPWPRTQLARIIDRLKAAGARTITLDLILAERDRLSPEAFARLYADVPELAPMIGAVSTLPSNDARLAEAIAAAPVILGFAGAAGSAKPPPPLARFAYAGDDPQSYVPRFSGAISDLPELNAAASGLGAVNWIPHGDQVIRRVPLLVSIAGKLYPSLPLETLRVARNETTVFVRSSGGSGMSAFGQRTGVESVRVGTTVLPTDADGELWLRLSRADGGRYIPAHSILDGSVDAGTIAGRHILIGTSAIGLLDLRATPLETAVPGVEIHAQALEQMLSGEHLSRPAYATGAELLFLIVFGAVVAWMIYRLGAVAAAAVGALAILTVVSGSWLAYVNAGLLFDPVYPSLAILLLYLATSLNSYIETESDRNRVRSAFSHYVAAPLVEELARHHEKLKLGGETREVSVLFADVRGFTHISEGLEAEELIRFLNRLFTPLSEVILAERGTIDKFMGDAVMAFWNAPLADARHAHNACTAALRMLEELGKLNAVWAAEAASRGEAVEPVRIGIGLNTGACCVGNVGSPQRFDYSILGDVVNVASRLEEATKTYRVPIVAGEHTAGAAPELAFLEIDAAMMRGKERVERVFALLGGETVAASERFRKLKQMHGELLAAMASGDLDTARARLEGCRSLAWVELASLFESYARRLERGA
jgi:adenylate cyclase